MRAISLAALAACSLLACAGCGVGGMPGSEAEFIAKEQAKCTLADRIKHNSYPGIGMSSIPCPPPTAADYAQYQKDWAQATAQEAADRRATAEFAATHHLSEDCRRQLAFLHVFDETWLPARGCYVPNE
jgi:hypothetical protein